MSTTTCRLLRYTGFLFSVPFYFSFFVAFFVSMVLATPSLHATPEQLIDIIRNSLRTNDRDQAQAVFERLGDNVADFTDEQRIYYYLLKSSFLGLNGQHRQRAELVNRVLSENIDPNMRVKFYYQLSDSYLSLGLYERALINMNKGVKTLPRSTDINGKVAMLQIAVSLMISLNAFDDAMTYAVRMHKMAIRANDNNYVCQALANILKVKIELSEHKIEQQEINRAMQVCEASDFMYIYNIIRVSVSVYLIQSGDALLGIQQAHGILQALNAETLPADSLQDLYLGMANGYQELQQFDQAERYAKLAFEQAKQHQTHHTLKESSFILAKIKRQQDLLLQAFEYYDVYIQARDRVEKERVVKSFAYQRVKYDSLDKTNQVALLKEQNSNLSLIYKLQQRNNQNLMLAILLGGVLLIFLSILLVFLFKRKQALIDNTQQETGHSISSYGVNTTSVDLLESQLIVGNFAVILLELEVMTRNNSLFDFQSVVELVSKIWRDSLRSDDKFVKVGEQKFVICLLDSNEQGATVVAKRCQNLINQIELEEDEVANLSLNHSIGIAILEDPQCDYQTALSLAEAALSAAKEQGKNSIYVNKE